MFGQFLHKTYTGLFILVHKWTNNENIEISFKIHLSLEYDTAW